MINSDTVKLLKECNSGIKMGVTSIEEVIDNVQDDNFKELLSKNKKEHQELGTKTHKLLNEYSESGKEPNAMAKGMSWIKTNLMMSVNGSDNTIADLMTDGCNMGVKSLNRYLNQYKAADEKTKNITKKLIRLEEKLTAEVQKFL